MAELLLTGITESGIHQLQDRAAQHGRTAEEEAKSILAEALRDSAPTPWAHVDAIYSRLASSKHAFSDSADLLRQDRDR